MKEAAWAKINLTLRIGARRAGDRPAGERPAGDRPARTDGLHEVCSLVVFADLADHLVITSGDGFEVNGVWADKTPQNQDNLALKALRFLGTQAHIRLEKNIPVGAGLGGGSADAAAVVRALRPDQEASALMALGADVPACFLSQPLWMSGAGERVERLSHLPPLWCVLTCPDVHISTADIFARWDQVCEKRSDLFFDMKRAFERAEDLFQFCARERNDFEPLVCDLVPDVKRALDLLKATKPGFAGMSGSGAACFALYADADEAQRAAQHIRENSKNWVWHGRITDRSKIAAG